VNDHSSCKLITKPQAFYKTVHKKLGFKEQGPRVLRNTDIQCPTLNDKEWDFGAKFKKMEEFFIYVKRPLRLINNQLLILIGVYKTQKNLGITLLLILINCLIRN
jgi:hypothetical protein